MRTKAELLAMFHSLVEMPEDDEQYLMQIAVLLWALGAALPCPILYQNKLSEFEQKTEEQLAKDIADLKNHYYEVVMRELESN